MAAVPAELDVSIAEAMRRASSWWRATRDSHALGFPRRTVLARIAEEGPAGARQVSNLRPRTWLSPEVEATDRLIARMPRGLRDVLEADCGRWAPVRALARELGCTVHEFKMRREQAYGWLAGGLTLAALGFDARPS